MVAAEMETITGRLPKPLSKKLNPLWWFQNDDEQKETDPDAQWYHPEWPQWRRHLYWNYLRIPCKISAPTCLGCLTAIIPSPAARR